MQTLLTHAHTHAQHARLIDHIIISYNNSATSTKLRSLPAIKQIGLPTYQLPYGTYASVNLPTLCHQRTHHYCLYSLRTRQGLNKVVMVSKNAITFEQSIYGYIHCSKYYCKECCSAQILMQKWYT